MSERGEACNVVLAHWLSVRTQLCDRDVEIPGVPQGDRVDDDSECAELVFLSFPVFLVELAAFAVEDFARQSVAGLLDGGLCIHDSAVGVIKGVDHGEKVLGLGDASILGEGLSQRRRTSVAAKHPQYVVGTDLMGDQGPGYPKHVWPPRDHHRDGVPPSDVSA